MKFKEGNKGRPKGAKGTTSAEAKLLFADTLALQSLHVEQALNKLRLEDSEKYLRVFALYAKFFIAPVVEETTTAVNNDMIPIFQIDN